MHALSFRGENGTVDGGASKVGMVMPGSLAENLWHKPSKGVRDFVYPAATTTTLLLWGPCRWSLSSVREEYKFKFEAVSVCTNPGKLNAALSKSLKIGLLAMRL